MAYLVTVQDRGGTFYQETFEAFDQAVADGLEMAHMYPRCVVRLYNADQLDAGHDGLLDAERWAWQSALLHQKKSEK